MNDLLPFLKELISAPGLSGYESPVRNLIEEAWRPLSDELHVSRLGSLHALQQGSGAAPRHSILFAAHMDAIGLMVTDLVDGFLRVGPIGGVDPRVLPGQLVSVFGRETLPGVVVQPPAHLLPADIASQAIPLEYLLVDVGLAPRQVEKLVRVGDLVTYAQEPLDLGGDYLAGHSLDNRASVAAVTHALEILHNRAHVWDVWAVATCQEEVSLAGAMTSAFQLRPSLAIAIDVTFASGPGANDYRTVGLGKGLTLGWGANIHQGVHRAVKQVAEKLELPFTVDPMPTYSGTDAMALQIAGEGIPTLVVSIPLRYMHTPVEVISMKDIRRAGRLLAEFAAGLDETFMDRLSWDE